MSTIRKSTRAFNGILDWGDLSDLPDGTVSHARQVDFGYPGQMRGSLGMTRHTNRAASGRTWDWGSNDAVRNIVEYTGNGEERLICTKERNSYTTWGLTASAGSSLWDISTADTASFITANLTSPSSSGAGSELYQKPWPAVQFKDDLFMVNGQTTFRTAISGANTFSALTYGIALSHNGTAWTTSDIGVVYGGTSTVPTLATTATAGGLKLNSTYGVRLLGYDTDRASYSDLSDRTNADMEAFISLGNTATSFQTISGITPTAGGFDEIRVFRTQADGATYYLDGSLTTTGLTVTHSITDVELAQKAIYNPGGPPPDKFYLLTSHNERLCGIGATNPERLYFCNPSNGHEWSLDDEHYRELPARGKPIALSSTGQVLHIHYQNGRLITLVGQDVKTARITEDCASHWGTKADASIARDTHRIVYVGQTGVYQFTGQACPEKITHPINDTWKNTLTKASLDQAVGMIWEREGENEYWASLPQDNMLIRVPLGIGAAQVAAARIGIDRCHATGLGTFTKDGTYSAYIGTNEGAIFQTETGTQWGTTGQLLDTTLTTASTASVTLTTATTADFGQLGMPFVITNGAAEGSVGWITSQPLAASAATVDVTPDFSTTPAAGASILVGALPYEWYSQWDDRGYPSSRKHWKYIDLEIVDDANASNRNALMEVWAVAMDYVSRTPRSSDLEWKHLGFVDFQVPESGWLTVDLYGKYLALHFRTMDYQVTRYVNSWTTAYEMLRPNYGA